MTRKLTCSFCGREESDTLRLLTKDSLTYICNECLDDMVKAYRDDQEVFGTENKEEEENFDLTPVKIKDILDQYIIGQDYAKKILSVAVYNHYKMLHYYEKNKDSQDAIELQKSNILMCGPSGVGKTEMIKQLAKILDVPMAITDATSLTESGRK